MRLAAHTTGILDFEREDGLAFLERLGVNAVEVACAGVFKDLRYGDPAELVRDEEALRRWLDAYARHGLEICALSIHGEPLSPDEAVAGEYRRQFRDACALAEKIGVSRLSLVAGVCEGAPGDSHPAWIVGLPAEWPTPNQDVLRWQWEERLLPYWAEQAKVATDHGCELCFEMTVWDLAYNPAALLRLRKEIGEVVRCNFDPSHLFYQGIDVFEAVSELREIIRLVHVKDTRINEAAMRRNGWFHNDPRTPLDQRPWSFATVGYGHDAVWWGEFITTLRLHGYDDVLSIEHEDPFMAFPEGVEKAVRFRAAVDRVKADVRAFGWRRPGVGGTAHRSEGSGRCGGRHGHWS